MTKKHPKVEGMNMPATLKAAFGPPPLLRFEDPRAYDTLMAETAASIVPTDTIEWLLIRDVVDLTWEIMRYRRFKTALVDSEIKSELSSMLSVPEISETETTFENTWPPLAGFGKAVTRTRSEEELKELRKIRDSRIEERRSSPYFADKGRNDSVVYARAFMEGIENVNKIETLLQFAERRRNAALTKIEQYRASRAASHRGTSSKVIDGDFEDLSAANAPRNFKKSA